MKPRRLFASIIALHMIVLLCAQCDFLQSATKYNDDIIGHQTKVIQKLLDLADSFKRRNPDEMNKKLTALQTQASQSADAVNQMEAFKGDSEFKNAVLDLLEFYETICAEEMPTMVEILSRPDSDIGREEIAMLKEIENRISLEEKEWDKKLQLAQLKFADKFGVKIRTNPIQKRIDNLKKG